MFQIPEKNDIKIIDYECFTDLDQVHSFEFVVDFHQVREVYGCHELYSIE